MSERNGVIYKELPVGFDENDDPIIKKIGFSFTMNFWNDLCKAHNKKLNEVHEILEPSSTLLESYINILYFAAAAYCEVRDKDVEFTKKIAGEWVSYMEQGEFEEIIKFMLNTRLFGKNTNGLKANREKAA